MMIQMIRTPGYEHVGYTKAVDWWSLGVTMYRLLSKQYPFKTDVPQPATPMDELLEGSARYAVLLEKVDYSLLAQWPDMVSFIQRLLSVDDSKRLGYGPSGSSDVSAHRVFSGINWMELEQKQAKPPPLPIACQPQNEYRESMGLNDVLRIFRRSQWMEPPNWMAMSPEERRRAEDVAVHLATCWDFTSPAAVLAELDIPNTSMLPQHQ